MPWFCAHAVVYFQFKDGKQDHFPVWENVYLIQASDAEQAWTKGIARARSDEGDFAGSLHFEDRPATLVFAGLRKVISVSHLGTEGQIADGDEVTFSQCRFADTDSFRKFVNGEEATGILVE